MPIQRNLRFLRWIPFVLSVCLFIAVPAAKAPAGNWFKAAFNKKATGPLSYAQILANTCYGAKKTSIMSLQALPLANAAKTPVIYPQEKPEAHSLAVSPDGEYIVSADMKGNVRLWEKTSGRLVWIASVHPKGLLGALDLAFSPDGSKIFSLGADQQGILALDPTSGEIVDRLPFGNHQFPGKKGQVFSAQGTVALVNAAWDKSVLVELASRKIVREFTGQAMAISPGGDRVATTVAVWDTCSGRQKKWAFKQGDLDTGSNGAFSPDGSRLALWTSAQQLVMLDAATGKRLWEGPPASKEPGGFGPQCIQLSFSGDGRHLFFHGSYPPLTRALPWSILAVDAMTGKPARVFAGDWLGTGGGVTVTPDGRNTVIGFDPGIVFLDDQNLTTVSAIQGHTRAFPFSINARGEIVTPYHQWDPQSGQPVRNYSLPEDIAFSHVALSSDDRVLTTVTSDWKAAECRVVRWDARSGKALETVTIPAPSSDSPNSGLLAVVYSPGHQYVALKSDIVRTVIYSVRTGRQISAIQHLQHTTMLAFSGDDRFVAAAHSQISPFKSAVGIWDIKSGKMVREFNTDKIAAYFSVHGLAIGPGNGTLLVTGFADKEGYLRALLNTRTGAVIWKHNDPASGGQTHLYRATVSPDGKTALAYRSDGYLSLVDLASGRILREFEGGFAGPHSARYAYSPDSARIYGTQFGGELKAWETRSGKNLVRIMEFAGGEWLGMTPAGYYASSEKADQFLNVRVGLDVQGVDQYYEIFYRPDLVAENLKHDSTAPAAVAEPMKNLLQVAAAGTPPRVLFRSPSDRAVLSKRDVEVAVEVIDTGGGIGRIEWKINGVTVGIMEDAGRGVAVVEAGQKAENRLSAKQVLTLSPGENVIQVIANNTANAIASVPASLNLTCRDDISGNPSLYLITVGINKYRDGSLRLKYSVPDAQSVSKTLDARSRTIFEKIVLEQVFDENATMAGIQEAFNKISHQIQTQDVFVFYVAGHGVAQGGRFYLLPYDFRYRNEKSIREKGITQDHIQKWLASIPARKSLILMDTCNSGAFAQSEAKQRGIAEKTAINRLTRATGRAIIVAAKDNQPAMEGYKGHGVFTYVLINAFQEADQVFGNRDGQTSIFELAAYIDEHVPEITFRQFGYEQVPQVNMQGRDFPIATAP